MSMALPGALRAALGRALDGVSRSDLAARAARMSEAYRAGRASDGAIREEADALAYALVRLPATYAACTAVFAEAARMAPGFAPTSLLDAGAGPGGTSWAALEVWPRIASATLLDDNRTFLDLAATLRTDAPAALRAAGLRRADLTGARDWPVADLVVASYALAEIAADRQGEVVGALWDACSGLLVLVEPGTPAGYGRILAARDTLIASGGTVLAPCPHAAACPLTAPDWCHFAQRLPRSRDHRAVKGVDLPFEDEKYAYLVVARPSVGAVGRQARVLAPPRTGKPGIDVKLCTPEGEVEQRFAAKRDKDAYRIARRLEWGDVWSA